MQGGVQCEQPELESLQDTWRSGLQMFVISALSRDSLIDSQGSRTDTGLKGFTESLHTQVTFQISALQQR